MLIKHLVALVFGWRCIRYSSSSMAEANHTGILRTRSWHIVDDDLVECLARAE